MRGRRPIVTQATGRPPSITLSASRNHSIVLSLAAVLAATTTAVPQDAPAPAPGGYSLRLGGDGDDWARDVVADVDGRTWVVGSTRSSDFPGTDALLRGPDVPLPEDGFVASVAPDGTLRFASRLGGSAPDDATCLAIAADGSILIGGRTRSTDFLADGAPQGDYDAFVVRVSAQGDRILAGALFGGSAEDAVEDIAIAPDGSIAVAGWTRSRDFAGSAGPTTRFDADPFVARLSADLTTVLGVRTLDGRGEGRASALTFDTAGRIAVTGFTTSTAFDVVGEDAQPFSGDADGSPPDVFVTLLDLDLDVLWSSSLGGAGYDYGREIIARGDGSLTLFGEADAPVAGAGYEYRGRSSYLSEIPAGGGTPTFVGWANVTGETVAPDAALSPTGVPWVTSNARYRFDDHTDDAFDLDGGPGVIIQGGQVPSWRGTEFGRVYSTGIRGTPRAIAVPSDGTFVVVGETEDASYATFPDATPTAPNSGRDAFVLRLDWQAVAPVSDLAADAPEQEVVDLTWTSKAHPAAQLEILRNPGPGLGPTDELGFEVIATLPPDAESFRDADVAPGAGYDYCVLPVFPNGLRVRLVEVHQSALPSPPVDVEVAYSAAGRVELTWANPNTSPDMGGVRRYRVERQIGDGEFRERANYWVASDPWGRFEEEFLGAAHTDVTYRVVAVGGDWAEVAVDAVLPRPQRTFDLRQRSGRSTDWWIADNKVRLSARLDTPIRDFNHATDELVVVFGNIESPTRIVIPANDPGWRRRGKRRLVWRTPVVEDVDGDEVGRSVRIDLDQRARSLSIRGDEIREALTGDVVLGIGFGQQLALDVQTWRATRGRWGWRLRR